MRGLKSPKRAQSRSRPHLDHPESRHALRCLIKQGKRRVTSHERVNGTLGHRIKGGCPRIALNVIDVGSLEDGIDAQAVDRHLHTDGRVCSGLSDLDTLEALRLTPAGQKCVSGRRWEPSRTHCQGPQTHLGHETIVILLLATEIRPG